MFQSAKRIYSSLVLGAFALMASATAHADTYYVAVNGKATNNGTLAYPWPSVDVALAKVGGGNTIVLKPGYYDPIYIGGMYAGTQLRPTIIRSQVKWQAIIKNAPIHGITSSSNTPWVVIDGFEVCRSVYDGIKLNGNNDTVRNCWS